VGLGYVQEVREQTHFPFAIFDLSFVIAGERMTNRKSNDKWKMENGK
jgi:hypothetical protein